jgi:hypothetical protein
MMPAAAPLARGFGFAKGAISPAKNTGGSEEKTSTRAPSGAQQDIASRDPVETYAGAACARHTEPSMIAER